MAGPRRVCLLGQAHAGRLAHPRIWTDRLQAEGCAVQAATDLASAQAMLSSAPTPSAVVLLAPDDPHANEATVLVLDAAYRDWLAQEGRAYAVAAGDEDVRWLLLRKAAGLAASASSTTLGGRRWTCESCSDPDCEHRLFSELIARRG